MSTDNFEGDGFADQPSIIYAFNGGDEIREISRSGYGQPGPSPGDIIERESTRSNPTERLPELELPGRRGLKEEDCGDDYPAFACKDCGHPLYVGRTCQSPVCKRCWPAAVKEKAVRLAGKLEAFRKVLNSRHDYQRKFDFNHVVASLPDFLVDSEEPYERGILAVKTLLEKKWGIEGFAAIYHPYRIKKEYRTDQYDHGGAEGEGDMTWKEVLNSEDPEQYIKFEPHFHLFFPAVRCSFDYNVAEAVQDQSGWLFHRVTKSGEDNNISVRNLEDLIYQITYCFSHAGVHDKSAGRFEFASRMKGDLHNEVKYVQEEVEDKCLAIFCEAAPKLLGVRFSNISESTCDVEVSGEEPGQKSESNDDGDPADSSETMSTTNKRTADTRDTDQRTVDTGVGVPKFSEDEKAIAGEDSTTGANEWKSHSRHPLLDVWHQDEQEAVSFQQNENSRLSRPEDSTEPSEDDTDGADSPDLDSSNDLTGSSNSSDSSGPSISGHMERCGGEIVTIAEAAGLLENNDWCQQAPHVSGLRTAVKEWKRRKDADQDLPWVHNDDDGDRHPEVVRRY